jgi:5-methylcytosine-specific restriction endonuclease McrA
MSQNTELDNVDEVVSTLVQRSEVPQKRHYGNYLQELRIDFIYSCAYCGITEFEAQGIRMTIDHYEPRRFYPKLENDYGNLMYCCDRCNTLKGDRNPSLSHRERGLRFFRPDQDYRHEHFSGSEEAPFRLNGRTPTGDFTIEFLDLNRQKLVKLREIRHTLTNAYGYALHGIRALNAFSIDRLPREFRATARRRIEQWRGMFEKLANDVDTVLTGIAFSGILDVDPEKETRAAARAAAGKRIEGLVPGESWRTRAAKRVPRPKKK